MNIAAIHIFVIQLFLQADVQGTPLVCTWQGFRQCTNNLPSLTGDVPPYFDNEQLSILCTTWNAQKQCIDDLLEACEDEANNAEGQGRDETSGKQAGSLIVEEGALNQENGSLASEMTTSHQQPSPKSTPTSAMDTSVLSERSGDSSLTYTTKRQDQPDSRLTTDPPTMVRPTSVKLDMRNGQSTMSDKEHVDAKSEASTENERTIRALRALKNSYDFFCEFYKRSVYRQEFRPCLVEKYSTLRADSDECQGKYNNATWNLNIEHPPHYQNICSAANDFFACQGQHARESCRGKAGTWFKNYQMAIWKVKLENLNCKRGRLLDDGTLGIVCVCGGSLLITIILSVISIYVIKPKDSSREEDIDKFGPSTQALTGTTDETEVSKAKESTEEVEQKGATQSTKC